MQPGFNSSIPDGLLAAMTLAENPRPGVRTSTRALHRGFGFVMSNTNKDLRLRWPEMASGNLVVLNNPVEYIDPDGLKDCDPREMNCPAPSPMPPIWDTWGGCGLWGSCDNPGQGRNRGGGGQKPPPTKKVDKPFKKIFKCNATPQQLLSGVESNFWTLASYTGSSSFLSSYTLFAPAAIVSGQTVNITAGVTVGGGAIDAHNWQVTVGAVSSTSFTFNTVQGQHAFYPGAVTFSAASAGAGQVSFSVNVDATYANWGYWAGGKVYGETAEGNTWNNLINNVASYCSTIP